MTTWRKSSRSGMGAQDADCVELAALSGTLIGIRDSKNPTAGHLSLTSTRFATLLVEIKAGRFRG